MYNQASERRPELTKAGKPICQCACNKASDEPSTYLNEHKSDDGGDARLERCEDDDEDDDKPCPEVDGDCLIERWVEGSARGREGLPDTKPWNQEDTVA